MAKFIDGLDYLADAVEVAPPYEWRIMQINVAKVPKIVPRYCAPTCPDYRKDSDKMCLKASGDADVCESYVFDMHKVEKGERVFDVLFATHAQDRTAGLAWRVGEGYLIYFLGKERVTKMLEDYMNLTSSEGFNVEV